jgi:hypothetical protein
MPGPCTLVGYINPNDAGDPMPAIVRFRMRTSAAEPVTFRLATVTKQGDTLLAQAVGTGATVTTQGTGETEEFPARLAVNQREHIALDAPAAHVVYNQGGQRVHAAVRAAARGGPGTPRRLEPPDRRAARTGRDGAERDGDGFGDETQDSCPTERTNQGACDTTGPRVRRIAVRRAGCGTGSQRTRPSPSASSERAAPATSPCAGVHRRGAAGANVRSLPRRFRSRNLPAGTYRLIVRAVDAAGSATRKTKRFTVE